MDLDLVLLIAAIAATIVVWTRLNVWRRSGRPGNEYRRVFTSGAAGLLFLITGLLGWPMDHDDGGAHGPDDPIWWQVLVGAALLLLATWWARQVPEPPRGSDSHSGF